MRRLLPLLPCLMLVGCMQPASNEDVSKLVKVIYKIDQKIDVVDKKVDALEQRVNVLEGGRPTYIPPKTYTPTTTYPTYTPVSTTTYPASYTIPSPPKEEPAPRARAVMPKIDGTYTITIISNENACANKKVLDRLHDKYDAYLSK